MRQSILLAILAMTLVVPPLADATVRKQSFTGTVRAGDEATLTVSVSPRARCGIKVVYDTVTSRAGGLGRKSGTTITWRWRVGTNTNPGRWPVTVDCGKTEEVV